MCDCESRASQQEREHFEYRERADAEQRLATGPDSSGDRGRSQEKHFSTASFYRDKATECNRRAEGIRNYCRSNHRR